MCSIHFSQLSFSQWCQLVDFSLGFNVIFLLGFNLSGPLCFEAVGTIDGKFDCGYLVSVKLGSEILSGVLYHPDHAGPSSSLTAKPCTPFTVQPQPLPHSNPLPQPHHSGRRKRKRRGDPGRPKPNRSGYNFFFAEKHSMLKSLYPNREREFTKMIGESWNNLTPEERTVSFKN